jgi:hypothetical protein
MSPIGRVFIVLNLILAGTFVGFAGTYLKRADDWKTKHGALDRLKNEMETRMLGTIENFRKGKNDAQRQLNTSQANLHRETARKDELTKENEALDRRLVKLESDYAVVAQNTAAMAKQIEVAHQTAENSMARAIAAEEAKDAAVDSDTKGKREIDRLNFTIRNKDTEIANLNGTNNKLDQIRREQKVLLDLVRIKVPGVFATLQPSVSGRVEWVATTGKLITVAVNAGGEFLKAGHRFAIYNRTDGYLGDAVVTEWDGSKYAFATLHVTKAGARKVRVGDMASTNLSGNNTAKNGN